MILETTCMNPSPTKSLLLADLQRALLANLTLLHEVPVEFAKSIPLPTLRWGQPAWAVFASPALRLPGHARLQGPPKYYTVISAYVTGEEPQLLLHSRTDAAPLTDDTLSEVSLPNAAFSLEEVKGAAIALQPLLDAAAKAFFAGSTPGDSADLRKQTIRQFRVLVPFMLWPHYAALVPDFWSWLSPSPSPTA